MFRRWILFLAAVILGGWPSLQIARAGDTSSSSKQLTEEVIPGQEAANPAVWPKPMEGQPKEIFPEDVVAMSLIDEGKRHMAEGDYEEAVERFERAVSMSPSQPRGYYFLARISFLQRQYRQALAFLNKAELLFGSSPEWQGEVCTLRGAVYEEGGDQAKARLAYERALRFNPQNLSALSGLTRLHEGREETNELPSR
jgi:tetratricopeptide (TPR) repeat protein